MDRRYASFVCVATWLLHSKLAVPAQVHGQDLSDGETLCDVGVIACTDEGALSQMAGPAERPRDWPHGQCIDRKDRCGEWARLGHCEGFTAEYMARWCSRSCSRCSDSPRVVFEGASSYGRIYVVDEGNLRHLRFDHWAGDDQSSIHLGPFQPAIPEMSAASTEKTRPRQQTPAIRPRSTEGVPVEAGIRTVATEYVRYSAGIASLLGSRATMHKAANGGENAGPRRALVIGIGGGSYVRLLRGSFPHCAVDGVELDPIVLQVGHFFTFEQGSWDLTRPVCVRLLANTLESPSLNRVQTDCYDYLSMMVQIGSIANWSNLPKLLAQMTMIPLKISSMTSSWLILIHRCCRLLH
eukprot:SAG31_NODE_174_length_21353_cov_23.387974_3_plen_353_part_00